MSGRRKKRATGRLRPAARPPAAAAGSPPPAAAASSSSVATATTDVAPREAATPDMASTSGSTTRSAAVRHNEAIASCAIAKHCPITSNRWRGGPPLDHAPFKWTASTRSAPISRSRSRVPCGCHCEPRIVVFGSPLGIGGAFASSGTEIGSRGIAARASSAVHNWSVTAAKTAAPSAMTGTRRRSSSASGGA